MIQIVPAILATTEEEYKQKLSKVESSGLFKDGWVQIDLMDNKGLESSPSGELYGLDSRTLPFSDEKGKFVQKKTIGPETVKKYRTGLKIEAHLMVSDPHWWVRNLKDYPIVRFVVSIGLNKSEIDEFVSFTKSFTDAEIGFYVNPETSLNKINDYLDVIDSVLIMSVHPGAQGRPFIPESIDKIKECSRLRSNNNLNFLIGVDGGISPENAEKIVSAGADYLVVGSALFEYDNLEEGLEKFWEAISG